MIGNDNRAVMFLKRAFESGIEPGFEVRPAFVDVSALRVDPTIPRMLATLPRPSQRKYDSPTDQLNDPARDTRAQLYQDVGFEWADRYAITADRVYEVARFQAAPDEVGVVKYCGTYIEIESPDPPYYKYLEPGDPYAVGRAGTVVRWILRLHQGTFQSLGPQWSGTYAGCLGYGYGPLPFWEDYRFRWGRTANDVWWLVPRDHALRLYAWIKSTSDPVLRLTGRLQGYTQPVHTLPAGYNVSHGWS